MKSIWIAIVIALAAGPALAREQATPRPEPGLPAKSQQEIEADKAAERAYQKSLKNIPDQGPVDPWGNVRDNSAKTVAKPVVKSGTKPKPKAQSTEN